ncbi:MAG: HAMP domain-containing sensor histidine kinase [Terrisporobacter sp.]|uniref:HAMP domain-containing sensor histidine kinase n=1 Tax=Terrisporobacter sp. TaxID=1965305 RepID=UPI002FCC63D2
MRKGKGFKFTCLVISFICISAILSTIPASINLVSNGSGILTSYMHSDEMGINSNFYKSRQFDNNLIGYLIEIGSASVRSVDEGEDKKTFEKDRKNSESVLKELSNINYFIVNNDTKEINTNTKYKKAKEFEKNINGECDVKISSINSNVSYIKDIDGQEYKKLQVNNQIGYAMRIPNGDIYMSIPKDFENTLGTYDKIYESKSEFETNIFYVQVILGISVASLVLGIVAIFLYKINKAILFDEDSFWLKLSKLVPLELYLFGLLIAVTFTVQSIGYYYDLFSSFIFSFLGVGFIMTVFYIFDRQFKTYDNKIDIFKTTFIYRTFKLLKKNIKKTIKKSRGLTRSMPLSKRIIGISIICLVINVIGWFMDMITYGAVFSFGASIISIGVFTYYVLKKLDCLRYIMDGTQRIKDGDIHYKIDLEGEDNFTMLADNINNIRDGLDKAIDNQLRSERMKSELITNVSHDLKTPLTSIINYVELIKKEEDISPVYLKDYVNVLDSKSKRLKALIEDLFEASKASSGNIELNMEKIDLTQLLRQSIGELEEKISEANLDLKIDVPEEKVYIRADGRRLYRVLENLLSNISKYSLANTRVYINITELDGKVRLTMKNISSYELNFDPEEIMERFKRADDSRNTEGSGLGLAIARDLVNLQGGSFNLDIDGDLFKSIVEFNSIH